MRWRRSSASTAGAVAVRVMAAEAAVMRDICVRLRRTVRIAAAANSRSAGSCGRTRYSAQMGFQYSSAVGLTLLLGGLAAATTGAQAPPKVGNPEDPLPPNITHLTWFGERASWSPDGTRIAFMSKSFGDAFDIDVRTRTIRLLTHYPHAGFLRVQYLPNGDYFLIGARTFTDVNTTRGHDQEMWVLPHDFKPGDRARPLDHKISEGVAISRRAMRIAWS